MSKLTEKVYEYIKDRILSCEYKPGMRITEDMIANELGISRTPVREAMHRLAADQIITIYPNRYAEVVVFDKDRIRHIGAMRLALDMLSVYSCTHNGSVAEFDGLDELELEFEEAVRSGDSMEQIRLECEFHLQIARIAKNDDLLRQQKSIYLLVWIILSNHELTEERAQIEIQQHRDLIKAIRTQDTVTARRILCDHLQKTHGLSNNFIQYFD